MKQLIIAVLCSALILSCASASLRETYCEQVYNRLPPPEHSYPQLQYQCGECLSGYIEDVDGKCVAEAIICPRELKCRDRRREECGRTTMGNCGPCIKGYMEMEGVCVTEREVRELIDEIEKLIDEPMDMKLSTKEQKDTETDDKEQKQSENNEKPVNTPQVSYLDKKAEASINGQEVVVETTPKNNAAEDSPVAEDKVQNESIPIGDKRVPDTQSAKQAPAQAVPVKLADSGEEDEIGGFSKLVFFAVVLSVSLLCLTSLIIAGVCWYRLHKQRKSMEASEYKGYGGDDTKKNSVTKSDSGDRRLAQSAQMYHYQHHKQQMMALEKSMSDKMDDSEPEEDPEENEDGNYRVYECPGLAPTGEMEVQNPLFQGGNRSTESAEVSPAGSIHENNN